MNAENTYPQTLTEAVRFFANAEVATEFFVKMRWPTGVCCPHCGSVSVSYLKNQKRWQCHEKHPKRQFSAKTGTIFEESPLTMDKWFVAIWSITNAKNGISSCELARAIGITQKSAWHLLHRVRHAMKTGSFEKFSGEIEADECYIGGKFENMHASRRREMATKKSGKAIVHGIIQRHKKTGKDDKRTSKAIASVIPNAKEKTIMPIIRSAVEPGSFIYTDEAGAYRCINNTSEFVHQAIDHAETYVRGRCHTNSMENFWSLLKRMVKGTYVSVDAPHLGRYVDEELFRFNERELTDGQRFATVLPGVIGKRLTYKSLTGAGTLEGLARNEETGRDDVRPN